MRGARSRGCGAVRSGGCCIVVRRGGGETNATKRSAVGANIIIEPEQPHSRTHRSREYVYEDFVCALPRRLLRPGVGINILKILNTRKIGVLFYHRPK
jgi:hypothetical protein